MMMNQQQPNRHISEFGPEEVEQFLNRGEAWGSDRSNYIGASEVGLICSNDLCEWQRLYNRKIGIETVKANVFMKLGTWLEPFNRYLCNDHFSKMGGCIEAPSCEPISYPDCDFIRASPDGIVKLPGEGAACLECKSTSWLNQEQLLEKYQYQIQFQIACSNQADHGYLSCLYLNSGRHDLLKIRAWSKDLISAYVQRVVFFWEQHILKRVPPLDLPSERLPEPPKIPTQYLDWREDCEEHQAAQEQGRIYRETLADYKRHEGAKSKLKSLFPLDAKEVKLPEALTLKRDSRGGVRFHVTKDG